MHLSTTSIIPTERKYYLFKLILASTIALNYIGYGMSCENWDDSVYTYNAQSYCNGWPGVSLETCIAKCKINDVPSHCRRQDVECTYIIYHRVNKWCHLGDENCKPKLQKMAPNYIYRKGETASCFFKKSSVRKQY